MRKIIKDKQYDEERALYNLQEADVIKCNFAGEADGESVLKEVRDVCVEECNFSLRYPLWHAKEFTLKDSYMDELTRASIWYASKGKIINSRIEGIKCLRECSEIEISGSNIVSPEFGWKSHDIKIDDTQIVSEYIFLDTDNVEINRLKMKGKYSFQYMNNVEISNSELDTKDAFWHSKNVTVRDSIVKGEYLAWYSENLTLINCKIIGTQPLCYCKNLKLINCTMEQTDLAFEYSEVEADIKGNVMSIKNPKSGRIVVDSVDEIIKEDAVYDCNGVVEIRK